MSSSTDQGTPQFQNEDGANQGQNANIESAALNDALAQGELSPVEIKINDLVMRMASLEEQLATDGCNVEDVEFQLTALQDELTTQLNAIEPALMQTETAQTETGQAGAELTETELAAEETGTDSPIAPIAELAAIEIVDADQLAEAQLTSADGTLTGGIVEDVLGEVATTEVETGSSDGGDQLADNLANNLANIEPAAGDESGSGSSEGAGGFGFQSTFASGPIDGIEDVGPIDPTQLQYGIEFQNEEVRPEEEEEGPIREDDDPLLIKPDALNLDESNLSLNQSGELEVDFGNDGAGSVTATGTYNVTGSLPAGELRSNGTEVLIERTASGYEGTANGQTVFTLTIDPETGDYNYNQLLPFDHADGSDPNDVIQLEFGVQASDSDGDIATTTITINVADDAPISIETDLGRVDESNLNPTTSTTGTIRADFGNDIDGTISGNGQSVLNGLQSNGHDIIVSYDSNTGSYTGTANGQPVFTLDIQSNGEYTFELVGTVDHPNTSNPNDRVYLEFGVKATDFDGDSIDGTLKIKILDDGPVAEDDVNTFNTADNSTDGNVISGLNGGPGAEDDLSADQSNTVSKVSFEGNTLDVTSAGTTSIDGQYGTLEIANDGSYTYELFDSPTGGSETTYNDCAELNPVKSDVDGIVSDTLTKDGITISVANEGDYDLTWVDTHDGSGLGIDNLNAKDSVKNWPKGETFDISFAEHASEVVLTIAEIGDNNDDGYHGVDYTITFADGSTATGEQQFAPDQIKDGHLEFTISGDDFGGKLIDGIALNSTNEGDYKGASFLLNNVEVQCPKDIQDVFEYTLVDGDGDTSTATLTINGNGNGNGNDSTAEYKAKTADTKETESVKEEAIIEETIENAKADELEETQEPAEKAPIKLKEDWEEANNESSKTSEEENLAEAQDEAPIYNDTGAEDLYGGAETNVIDADDPGEHFICTAVSMGVDVIRDFGADPSDVLDFSTLIQGYDPAQQAIDSFVFAREIDGGTILSIDTSGSGDASKAVDLVALEGFKDIDLQAMVESGNINVM